MDSWLNGKAAVLKTAEHASVSGFDSYTIRLHFEKGIPWHELRHQR